VTRGPLKHSTLASSKPFIHSYDFNTSSLGGSLSVFKCTVITSSSWPSTSALIKGTRASFRLDTSDTPAWALKKSGNSAKTWDRVMARVVTNTTSKSAVTPNTPNL
jgi:hypothetical protein